MRLSHVVAPVLSSMHPASHIMWQTLKYWNVCPAAIEKGTANGSRPNGPAPKPVFTANTQVVLSFDSNKPSEAAGSSAAAAAPANGRAAEQPEAAGPAAAAAAGGARPLPPFLQSAMAGSAKPVSAWLMAV